MKTRITKTLALLAAFCGLQLFTATPAWAGAGDPTGRVISINIAQSSGDGGNGYMQDSDTVTTPLGTLAGSAWQNIGDQTGTGATREGSITTIKGWTGTATENLGGTFSWSTPTKTDMGNMWYTGINTSPYKYLHYVYTRKNGNNIEAGTLFTYTSVPYDAYDVIVYVAGSSSLNGGAASGVQANQAIKVNGKYYYGDTSSGNEYKTVQGGGTTTAWGSLGESAAEYGKNAIRITGLSGDLSISTEAAHQKWGIAAIQIVETEATPYTKQMLYRLALDSNGDKSADSTGAQSVTTSGSASPVWETSTVKFGTGCLKVSNAMSYVIDNIETKKAEGWTFSFWFHPNGMASWNDVLAFAIGDKMGKFEKNGSNQLCIYKADDSYGEIAKAPALSYTASAWNHIALVSTTSGFDVYCNGTYASSVSVTTTSGLSKIFIGNSGFSTARTSSALVDEVAIFNWSMTPAELNKLKNYDASEAMLSKWGNMGTLVDPGVCTGSLGDGDYAGPFTVRFGDTTNISPSEIKAGGTVKITRLTLGERSSNPKTTPTSFTITQGDKSITGAVTRDASQWKIYGPAWPGSSSDFYTQKSGRYIATFTDDVSFDTTKDISISFTTTDESGKVSLRMISQYNTTCRSGNYTPSIEIAGYYTPPVYTATVDASKKFSELTWDPEMPAGGIPEAATLVLNTTAASTLTLDQNLTAGKVKVTGSAALTLAVGTKVITAALDCSEAAGVTLDARGVSVTEVTRYVVAGTSYPYWFIRGSITGTPTVTCPTLPTGYTATSQILDNGVRLMVSSTSAKNGSVSMNIHNGTALSGEGNHGLHPIALANWGNIQVANNGTATKDGITFTFSDSVSGYGLNNTPPDMIQKQYMDDNNNGVTRKITVSGMTAKGYSKYRAIVYYSTDSANISFAPLSVTESGNTTWYAGPTEGSTTGGYTVKGSQNTWGETGPNHNANALGEGVNALVTDVMTADSITLNFLKKNGKRATPCAIQIVEVGVVAKIGDTVYSSLAEAEAAVTSGETIKLLVDCDEVLSTAKTFTFDYNGHAFNGGFVIGDGGAVTIAGTIDNAKHRYLLAHTTGNGWLKMNVGNNNIELQIWSDSTPHVANVNVEYLGTGQIHFVGSDRADKDKYTVSAGKTVKFENGTIWAKRSIFEVYGNLIAKAIKLGHEQDGAYTGKVTAYDGAVVKTGSVTFANKGGSSAVDVKSGGVLEFTQNSTSAIALVSSDKTYSVTLNGGTLRSADSSWKIASGISVSVAANSIISVADGKMIEFGNTFTGSGTFAYTGSGTICYNGGGEAAFPTAPNSVENWTGTVWLKNFTNSVCRDFGGFGAKVKFSNVAGWFNSGTFSPTLELDDDGNANPALTINNGSSGWQESKQVTFTKLKGTGTFKSTWNNANGLPLLLKDVSEFRGSLATTVADKGAGFLIGPSVTYATKTAKGQIVLDAGATAVIDSGKSWTAASGIFINGTISGSGTLASATTFGDGAEVDARTAQLTASGTLSLGTDVKVRVATAPTTTAAVKVFNGTGAGNIADVKVYVGDSTTAEEGTFKLFYMNDGVYVAPYAAHEYTLEADTTWAEFISGKTFGAYDNITIAAGGHKLTFTEKVTATYNLTISGDVTIAAGDALYHNGCWEDVIATFAQVTISGTLTSEIKDKFYGAFSTTANSIKLRAQNMEVISINIAGGSGGGSGGDSPAANLVNGTGFHGIAPTLGDSWNNINRQWQSGGNQTITINSPNAYDGQTTIQRPTMSLSATGKNTWQCGDIANAFLRGYLDDGNGVTVMVHGIPYTKYDVIVYATSDDAGIKLAPVTINGTQYTFADGETKPGSTVWGQGKYATPEIGKNALRINDCSGDTLTINATRVSGSPGGRATLCAVQVICQGEVVVASKYYGDVTGNATWTDGEDDENITKRGQTWANSQLSTLTLTNKADAATLTFAPTGDSLTGMTFKVVSEANKKMTIPYSSLDKLTFSILDFSEAFGKVEINMNDVTEGAEGQTILAGTLTGTTNITFTSTGAWGAYADATGIHMAKTVQLSRNNPVTGTATTFERSFFGSTSGSWNTLANWRMPQNGLMMPATALPGISGGDYPKILVDGNDSAQDTVSVNTLEGYNIQFAFLNGAKVTASTLTKMQTDAQHPIDMWIWVDGTSSFTVNALGDNQNWGTNNLYVAAENGITFPAFNKGATLNYYFTNNASVKFTGAVTAGTHTIKQMDLEVGMTAKDYRHVAKKTLATIGATGTTVTFAKDENIVVNLDNKDVTSAYIETVPACTNDVGTYTIKTEADGVYAYVVQYADKWDIIEPLTGTLTSDTAWSSIVWKDFYNHEGADLTLPHTYKVKGGDFTATQSGSIVAGSEIEIVSGTLELASGATIGTETYKIDNGATLLVKVSGLTASKVTNNGTLKFEGGDDTTPIAFTGDADFGVMQLAADTVVDMTTTMNHTYNVTGTSTTTSKFIISRSDDGTGVWDNSQFRTLTLVANVSKETKSFWLERQCTDATVDVVSKANGISINGTMVIGALSGEGPVALSSGSLTLNPAHAATYSGTSSMAMTVGGTAEQSFTGNYTGALTVNANALAALKVGATYALNVNNAGTLRLIDNETPQTTLTAATFNNTGTLNLSGTGINTLAIGTLTSFGTVTWPAEVAGTVKITGGGSTRDFTEIKTKLTGFSGAVEIDITETLAENAAGQVALTGAPAGAKIVLTRIDGSVIEGTATAEGGFTQNVTVLAHGAACYYDFTFTNTITTAKGSRETYTLETEMTMEYNAAGDALLLYCSPWNQMNEKMYNLSTFSVAMYGKVSATNNTFFISFGSGSANHMLFLATNEDGTKVNVVYYDGTNHTLSQITVPHMTSASHLYVFSKVDARTLDIYLDGALWERVTTDFDLVMGSSTHSGVQFGSGFGTRPSPYIRVPSTDKLADVGTMRIFDYVISDKQLAALKTEFPYDSPDTYARTVDTATTNWVSAAAWTKGGETFDTPDAKGAVKVTADANTTVSVNLGTETAVNYEKVTFAGEKPIKLALAEDNTIPVKATQFEFETDVTVTPEAIDLGSAQTTSISANGKLTIDLTGIDCGEYTTNFVKEITGTCTDSGLVEAGKLAIIKPTEMYGRDMTIIYRANMKYAVEVALKSDVTAMYWKPEETVLTNTTHLTDAEGTADYIWWQTMPITVGQDNTAALTSITGDCQNTVFLVNSGVAFDIGTLRTVKIGGTGSVKAQLETDPQPGDVVTLFTVASGTPTVAELKKPNGDVIDASYYTYANGVVTFKKEAAVGTQYYFTLKQAIEDTSATAVELIADITAAEEITVTKAISFDGGTNILSNVTFTFDGGTLTLNTGCIGIGHVTGMSITNGCCRFTETSKMTWDVEGVRPSGYEIATLSAAVRPDYVYEFIKSSFVPTDPTTEQLVPVVDDKGNDAGAIKLKTDWVVKKTGSEDPQVQAKTLNTPQNNGLMTWQNDVLGLTGTDPDAKPVVHFSQNQSESGKIAFTLNGVDGDSGATVKFKVYSADTPGESSTWTAASEETASGSAAQVKLPDSGVKYYKYDVITETSK